MPGFFQHIATTGYGYVDPLVSKARCSVPIVDSAVHRMELVVPRVIRSADRCVVAAVIAADRQFARGIALVGSGRLHDLCSTAHSGCLELLDRSDDLIDWMLPLEEPEREKAARRQAQLIPRVLSMPWRIPVRCIKIIFIKARGLAEVLETLNLTDNKDLLLDRVSRTSEGLRDATHATLVYLAIGGAAVVSWSVERAYVLTASAVGDDRASSLFAKVGDCVPPTLKSSTCRGRELAAERDQIRRAFEASATAQQEAENVSLSSPLRGAQGGSTPSPQR